MNSPLYSWLKNKVEHNEPTDIIRDYDIEKDKFSNKYSLYNVPKDLENDKKEAALIREITKRLPNILYFDDFSDRVPSEIEFNEDLKFSRRKDREWQEIVSEIFARAIGDFSLSDFVDQRDEDERNNFLSDVTDVLNKEIVDEWKKLKAAFSNISEETSELELKIIYENINEKHTFKFKVVDSENSGRGRHFNVSERSKGFQWFFNFIMKLKFNPKYTIHPENAIYLLDEPGSYLHASAQTELLKKLCSIGENNTILYCTHSQYLLDPDIINIAGIKIVTKENSKIEMCDYGDSTVQRSLGAFSALNDALHLKFGFNIDRLKRCILTEGIVDYYEFKMFLDLNKV